MATETINFPITLTPALNVQVTVQFQTVNGTAIAGTDFVATSGTLTFAPGETTKTIPVTILADPTANVNKAFGVMISNPVNATISTGTSPSFQISKSTIILTVTISQATISAVTAVPNVVLSAGTGANKNQFVDPTGKPVRLKSIAWYGYDGTDLLPHGMYAGRAYKDIIDQMRALGFNSIRIPFSDDFITSTVVFVSTGPSDQFVDPAKNPDLIGLTPIQAFHVLVQYCSSVGMYVILDHHRISMRSIHNHPTTSLTNAGSQFLNMTGDISDVVVGMSCSDITNYLPFGLTVASISGQTIQMSAVTEKSVPSGTQISFGDSGYGTDGWPAVDGATGDYTYGGSFTPRPYTEATWQAMWSSLATICTTNNTVPGNAAAGQYASNPALRATIVGFETHNEPYKCPWSVWAPMNERLFPVVHGIAPDWIMFVQGVGKSSDGTDTYWFGGYLRSATSGSVDGTPRPVVVSPMTKLAYSAHEYGISVSAQTWLASSFQAGGPVYDSSGHNTGIYPALPNNSPNNYPLNLEAVMETYWGKVFSEGVGPVWVSEFGFGGGYDYQTGAIDPGQLSANAAFELQWANAVVAYLQGDRNDGSNILTGTQLGVSFSFWSYNPENGNPLGGLVINSDYTTVQSAKMDVILPLVNLN